MWLEFKGDLEAGPQGIAMSAPILGKDILETNHIYFSIFKSICLLVKINEMD